MSDVPRKPARARWTALGLLAALGAAGPGPAPAPAQDAGPFLVSVPAAGGELDGDSVYSAASDDGRFVAYATRATNVVPADLNGDALDVIVRDLLTGESFLESKNTQGAQANGDSEHPVLSADGRQVIFQSTAVNLAAPDSNGIDSDIFVRDRVAGTTTIVSVSSAGVQGDGPSTFPDISADGRFAVFLSQATNLDPLHPKANEAVVDAFVRDLVAQTTEFVSVAPDGTQGDADVSAVAISGDGRFVAFQTASKLLSRDTNRLEDIYLWDRTTRALDLISTDSTGEKSANGASRQPAIDHSGRWIAFDSSGRNLIPGLELSAARRVYAFDRETGARHLVSRTFDGRLDEGRGATASICADGRYVLFGSDGPTLVPADTNAASDVFLHDLETGLTTLQSATSGGEQGDADSGPIFHAVSRGATTVAFRSRAANLVPGTARGRWRIYGRLWSEEDTVPPRIICADVAADGCPGSGAVVDYEVSVLDDRDPAPALACEPPPGSLFPYGVTTVACTATDASGNSETCSFEVTVRDRTPPSIQCPVPIRAACTSAAGAAVELTVSANDACDPSPTVTAEPPSGSTFAPGATDVTVRATDAEGNEATCIIRVLVLSQTDSFLRGDANADGSVNISDAVFALQFLFQGRGAPFCLDAADVDDDGRVNITDPVFLLQFLFQSGSAPPSPGSLVPGPDPTPDDLDCGAPVC